jgi:hypothetical protein
MLKVYNWNALPAADDSGNQEIEVSFRIQGVNNPNAFITAFQSGKGVIESIEDGESFMDYMVPLTNLAFAVIKALKKSK